MRIIAISRLREYAEAHPEARAALTFLESLFEANSWNNFNELRQFKNDVDQVSVASGRILQVFNVADGYRLVVHIHFKTHLVYIREFMTHDEYMLGKWKGRN
jgi:mRNA-degrading endonuclease HigB of HigAB toxin-antitoxin module